MNNVPLGPTACSDPAETSTVSAPVAVRFRWLTASTTRDGFLLRWRTASEFDTLGFNAYRETNGRRVRLNAKLIAARSTSGAAYSFRYRVPAGKQTPTRFWIQVVNLDGSRNWYGPVRVAARYKSSQLR